jgi:transcriptional regulator with XRE-family HTH domain
LLEVFMSGYRFNPQALRLRILGAGLRPESVAVAIGRSVESVRNYTHGRQEPRMSVFVALCRLLDCEPSDLFEEVEESEAVAS